MKKKILSFLIALTIVFGALLLIATVPDMTVTASAATCPIEGATGTGTEADPVIVDNPLELEKALEYNGTLYVVAKKFATSNITSSVSLPYVVISSKKVLYLEQDLEIRQTNGAKGSLFCVKDGGDFTIIADDTKKIKFTNTVLELAGSTAKATLKGGLRFETTTDDGSLNSYALVAHMGSVLIDGDIRFNTASLQNGAAIFKNGTITGKVALKGDAFKLYPGCVGFLSDKDQDFLACPNFGTTGTIREDLRVACIGGFNKQTPALEGNAYTSSTTFTAVEEKVFLGISKKYSFETADNTAWAEHFVYTPTGTIDVIDSTGNIIYSVSDSDSGLLDKNVKLTIDLKNVIKSSGKYRIRETIKLTRNGVLVTQHVRIFPVEVVEFNTFLGQSPAMPSGKTVHDLGKVSQSSYPITFYAHSISDVMKAEGYTSNAKLMIYDENDRYIYGYKAYCNNGTDKVNYDLNKLSAGKYQIVETVELYNKDKEKVKSAINTFTIDWTPAGPIGLVDINVNWTGAVSAPTSATKGIKVTGYKWEKYNGSGWVTLTDSDTLYEGNTYKCSVVIEPDSGYTLGNYSLRMNGMAATQKFGTEWYLIRTITRVVSDVYVYELARPEVGAYPDFTGDPSSAYTEFDKAEWFPCTANGTKTGDALTADDKFDEGYYRLEVTVKPPKGNDVLFEKQWLNVSTYDFGLLDLNGDDPVSWFYPDPEDHSVFTMWIVYHTDDAEGSYKLDLGGVTMKNSDYLALGASAVTTTKPSGGYAYYKDGVLTLNNYKDDNAELIFRERHLEINLIGENELQNIRNGYYNYGEYDVEDIEDPYCLTIGGEGSLRIGWYGNPSYVFAVNGDINFTGGKIRFYDGGYCGTYATKRITISGGAEVEFQAYCYGLSFGGLEELVVEDGSFYAFDGGSWENSWMNQKITFPEGYVYVYDSSSTLNPINPGIAAAKLSDAHKWDGVTAIGKYDYVWVLSEKVCEHSYDGDCDADCNDCGATRTAAEHNIEKSVIQASLTSNGRVIEYCTNCNYTNTYALYAATTFTLSKTTYTFDGKVKTPTVTVKDYDGNTLKKDVDYTVTYADGRRDAGTYKVTVKMIGNYIGSKTLSFTIKPVDISTCSITLSKTSYTFDGTVKKPVVTVKKSNGTKLTEGTSYTVSYDSGRVNAGTYNVTVKMKGNYVGEKTLSFKIKPVDISTCSITLSKTSYTFDGTVKKPAVTVKKSNGTKLTEGTSYTVSYASGRVNAGTYKVTVKMKGNYTGTKTLSFTIKPVDISTCSITLSKTSYTFDGTVKKPAVTVKKSNGTKLTEGTSYTVSYASGRVNAGTYKVTVKMKGNYTGTKTLSFTIKPVDISTCSITLSKTSYTFDGTVKKPAVTVKKSNGTKLTEGTSYTVSYASGRVNVGTYKVTVKMKGNYTGTKTLTFKINPPQTTVASLTAGTKSITVNLTKKTTQTTGYQIQYSTSKDFTNAKTKTLTSNSTVKTTLSGLTAAKTYYVRVRTYKTVNDVKYYSGWSAYKYVKTK